MICNRINVLHVDDSAEYLNFIRIALFTVNSHYQIESVLTVKEARNILGSLNNEAKYYHSILMDYDLGGSTNGLELVRNYLYKKIDIPVIMLSAYDDENLKKTAFSIGVSEYISKRELIADCLKLHNVIQKNIKV